MLRNRWVRRAAVGLAALFVLWVGGFFLVRHSVERRGEERHAAIVAHLDATDPRWRLADLDADRGTLPDDQNSALLVPQFNAVLVKPFNPARPDKSAIFEDLPPNRVLDDEGADALDRVLVENAAALAVARQFRHYPRGLRRYAIAPDFIGTRLPDLQDSRAVMQVLDLESERLSRDDRPGAALAVAPAMLSVARSIDGEPFLISALVRIACDQIAVRRLERTLGLGTPTAGLAEVQALLLAESEADLFFAWMRGERAGFDMLFSNLRDGTLPPAVYLAAGGPAPGPGGPRLEHKLAAWAHEPHLPNDHAAFLEMATQAVEARSLPEHQQRAAIKAIRPPPRKRGTLLTYYLTANFSKLHDANLRAKAHLRCAAVALAVERFRQEFGRWPEGLDELPRDLLRAVPLDPFDGQPVKYARRADGVTVYSVGLDEADDGGNVIDGPSAREPGYDLGFRLYDPDQRGLPAEHFWRFDWLEPPEEFRPLPPDPDAGPPTGEYGPWPREVGEE